MTGTHIIYRAVGAVAVFVATFALLLQTVCPAQLISAAAANLAQPISGGCHESDPAVPDPPNPEKKCCSGQHSPEVLLTATQSVPVLLATQEFEARSASVVASGHAPVSSSAVFGPPGARVLRI